MKTFFGVIFLVLFSINVHAQSFKNGVGIQFSQLDYFGPQTGKYFIHEGWNYPKTKFRTHLYWKPALQINYWKMLNSNVELKSNLIISKLQTPDFKQDSTYIKSIISKSEVKKIYFSVDEKVNYYFLKNGLKQCSPYVSTGFNFAINNSKLHFAIPIGVGYNLKITPKWLFNYESNYYVSFSKTNFLNHSFGMVYKWNARPKKVKKNVVENQIDKSSIEIIIKDTDNDGVVDSLDYCPNLAGRKEHFGCPDSDQDGIYDFEDKCPNEVGTLFTLGCADDDKDGVINIEDKCPNEYGLMENKGCPEIEEALIAVINATSKGIQFESSQAVLKEESYAELDKIVLILKEQINLKIEIEGHTDSSGKEEKNLILSQQRADVCKDYLVANGIDEDRITSVGFGSMKPFVDNDTPENRAKNRRIDFILVK